MSVEERREVEELTEGRSKASDRRRCLRLWLLKWACQHIALTSL